MPFVMGSVNVLTTVFSVRNEKLALFALNTRITKNLLGYYQIKHKEPHEHRQQTSSLLEELPR